MREILFRGKQTSDGKWVYGFYIENETFGNTLIPSIIPIDENGAARFDDDGYNIEIYVIPETVGQYTGLTDKNGKKIFEGDILKISFGKEFLKAVVKFGYYNQTDKILKSHLGFYFDFVDSESYRKDVGFWTGKTFSKIEIIGNIHENPELLKGSAKNE